MEEIHKKIDVKYIEHLEDSRDFYINELTSVAFRDIVGRKQCIDSLIDFIEKYNDIIRPLKKEWDERIDFWNENLFKYFKISFDNCGLYKNEIYVYPYKLLMDNEMLFGIFNENNNYSSGLKDSSFDFSYFYKYEYKIEEISKEEFLLSAHKNIEKPLTIRLDKLKNRDKLIE